MSPLDVQQFYMIHPWLSAVLENNGLGHLAGTREGIDLASGGRLYGLGAENMGVLQQFAGTPQRRTVAGGEGIGGFTSAGARSPQYSQITQSQQPQQPPPQHFSPGQPQFSQALVGASRDAPNLSPLAAVNEDRSHEASDPMGFLGAGRRESNEAGPLVNRILKARTGRSLDA